MAELIQPTIDVMIPVAPKDLANLDTAITNIRENCLNPIANIHIVGAAALRSETPYGSAKSSDIHWFNDENVKPSITDIHATLASMGYDNNNVGWYFQQVLKLGVFDYLNPDAQHVLEVDADYTFVKPTEFVDTAGRSLLAYGYPFKWNIDGGSAVLSGKHASISAASRLLPDWQPFDAYTGMQHHMVFDRSIIGQLVNTIQEAHGKPLWEAFLHCIETDKLAGISEFVLYRHFAHHNVADRVVARHINAVDIIEPTQDSPYMLEQTSRAPKPNNIQAVGCHRFRNYLAALRTIDCIPDDIRPQLLANPKPLSLHLVEGAMQLVPLDPNTMPGDKLDLTLAASS